MVIINNNWSPIPWGWGCGGHQCGSNNWMNNMLKYQFMFGMMNNISNMFRCYVTPPQQQSGFYPGLYLGGGGGTMPQNYEEYLQQQQDAQDLAELKSAYSEFNIRKVNDRYFAYLKNDKTQRVEADTIDELMDGLNEYVDANPDKFKAKPAARIEHEGEGNIEHDDGVDDADQTEESTGAGTTPPATGSGRGNANRAKLGALNDQFEWKNYTNLTSEQQTALGLSNDMTLDDLCDKLGIVKNDNNKKLLKDANPNGIKDNKVADLNRLTLIVKKQANGSGDGDLPEHWTRGNIQTSDKWKVVRDKSKVNSHVGAKSSAEFIAKLYSGAKHLKLATLTQLIIDNNPDIFDGNGDLKSGADLDKLIIPRNTSTHLTALGVIKTDTEIKTEQSNAILSTNSDAYGKGGSVRTVLKGHTKSAQYTSVKNNINTVTSLNVREFINGYEKNRGAATDHIIKEIWTESSDDNFTKDQRENCSNKIMESVQVMAEVLGLTNMSEYKALKGLNDSSGWIWQKQYEEIDKYILALVDAANAKAK